MKSLIIDVRLGDIFGLSFRVRGKCNRGYHQRCGKSCQFSVHFCSFLIGHQRSAPSGAVAHLRASLDSVARLGASSCCVNECGTLSTRTERHS